MTDTRRRTPARPRGFTLVEVLAALVLLSAVVAAAAPLLLEAQRALRPATEDAQVEDLALAADRVRAAPAAFGWTSFLPPDEVAWPERQERSPIRVRWLGASEAGGGWVAFEWRQRFVLRWLRPQPPQPPQQQGERR